MSTYNWNEHYSEYEQMSEVKRKRNVKINNALDAAVKRNSMLEAAFKHWHVVGKGPTDPCKTCGLPLADAIHVDRQKNLHYV